MATSSLWYVPHRPDLLLISPCDAEGPLPGPGAMFVSIDHLHAPPPSPAAASSSADAPSSAAAPSSSPDASAAASSSAASSSSSLKWRHPRATAFLTAYGDIAKQQPRVVRCACGARPCVLSALRESGGRGAVPEHAIPADWAAKWELPPAGPEHEATENRRAHALQLWLDCTARAEKELPHEEGKDHPAESAVLAAAEVMLTDYLKGRVCYACSVPSTKMQRCSRCLQARYCSRECQRAHWSQHKAECAAAKEAAAAVKEAAEAAAVAEGAKEAPAKEAAAPKADAAANGATDAASGGAPAAAAAEGAQAAAAAEGKADA